MNVASHESHAPLPAVAKPRASAQGGPGTAMPRARRALDSPAMSLDGKTRTVFESRFGHDFSRVRVHAGAEAGASARALNAQAYTVGRDVVFAPGRYAPHTGAGERLLAHELAHVAQQAKVPETRGRNDIGVAGPAQENEAKQASAQVSAGGVVPPMKAVDRPMLARFSDTQHHVIEEAALEDSGLKPSQIRSVERGNVKRDYSQIPGAVNAALIGKANTFGGYKPEEHFDNFIFDVQNDRWRTRGVGQQKYLHLDPKAQDTSPIDYIASQLQELAKAGTAKDESLEHLGNAFHTVEDFFAHSNFIELTRKAGQPGAQQEDLLTGSYDGDPANTQVSLLEKVGAVSTPAMQVYYRDQAESAARGTEPHSHSHLAKDEPEAPGFADARRLAALVIQDLAADVVRVMAEPDASRRVQMINDAVMSKIRHYLRPPTAKDRWWEGLVSQGGARMDARLAKAASQTPVTVNQAPFSPLRNLEASKDSPLAMPLGLAVPLGKGGPWLQAGAGVTRPSTPDPRFTDVPERPEQKSAPFAGVQITGHF